MDPSAQSQDMVMRMMARNSMSEALQKKIDSSVKTIATEAYDKAISLIRSAARRHGEGAALGGGGGGGGAGCRLAAAAAPPALPCLPCHVSVRI
jgi:hypothetical protein